MSTAPNPDHIDIELPDFDPTRHAGHLIETAEELAPKDMPVTMGKDHRAPGLHKVGEHTYYQHRGDSRKWPESMSDMDVNRLLDAIGKLWKDMWEVHREGMKQTMGELGTVLLSQIDVEDGRQVRISFVPKRDMSEHLAQIAHTVGTPNYDHVHDMHVTVILDRAWSVPYCPYAPLHVLIIANAKTDDEV